MLTGDDGGGYPGCTHGCIELEEKTGQDGRFELEAPVEITRRRDELGRGDTTGFSFTAHAPAEGGAPVGPVVEVSTRLERGDREITLPTMQLWRPEMRLEVLSAAEVRLRWSSLPKRYGRALGRPGAGVYPSSQGHVHHTGPAAARVDLVGLPAGVVWLVSASAQVGDESNLQYGSPPVALPDPPAPITRGRPCLVVGTAGTTLRGPCAVTDGSPQTSLGRVFRSRCAPDDSFCDVELPALVAVDLGAVSELALIDAVGECVFRCSLLLSSDGRTWRAVGNGPAPQQSRCRDTPLPSYVGTEDVVPPAGTRARYVALSGDEPDGIAAPRGPVGSIPSGAPAFEPRSAGVGAFDAVSAAEITVFARTAGPPSPDPCGEADGRLPYLGLPAAEAARERNDVVARVAAGLLAFAVALAQVRVHQQRRR
jgi:hypothetical protein